MSSAAQTPRDSAPHPGPLVSVVIPAHNVATWLEDLLESVLRQDVESMEVIVIDDHSTDGTSEILSRFAAADPRVRVIVPEHSGGANARNVGVAASSGRYLIFADSDDLVPPGAYRALVDSLEHSGSDIAFGDYLKFNANRTWRPTTNWKAYAGRHTGVTLDALPTLLRGRACWNKAFRRDFWVEHGLEYPEVARSNDIQPMVRAYLAADRVDVVGEVVYIYRQRPGGTSMTSKASLAAGLESYLGQELVCATLLADADRPGLLREYTSLFMASDGWVHLKGFAAATLDNPTPVPPAATASLRGILDRLDEWKLGKEPHTRRIPVELFAAGETEAAQVLMRAPGAQSRADEQGLDVLAAWLTAVETLDTATGLLKVWEAEIAPRVLGDVPFRSAATARPLLDRVAAAIAAGHGGIDESSSPGVARMRDVLARLDSDQGRAWLAARSSAAITADRVRRVEGAIEISGPVTGPTAGLVVAPYYSGGRHGAAVPLTTAEDGTGERWYARVPASAVQQGRATRLRAEKEVEPGLTVDVPVLLSDDATLPTNSRFDRVAVHSPATADARAIEFTRHAGVVRRAARAARREAKAIVKARLR